MSSFNATFFLTLHASSRANGAPHPVLYIHPDGGRSGHVVFQIPTGMSAADRLKVAESILRGATDFRDAIVADAERERTAADELAEARAEIARLKAEADGGAA